eukprot:2055054-Alexandrium_andersonii.AAC.1
MHTALGPGVAAAARRSPGDPPHRPAPAHPGLARDDGRSSGGESGWQEELAASRAGSARGSSSRDPRQ